jgi:hypothetical protein
MQFIQEFTLIQKTAGGATLVLILVLLLVSARRRRGAAAAPAETHEPAATKTRRGDRKKQSALPGRKRRKLAAEAAHSMGVDPEPIAMPQVPEVPTVSIPEIAVVDASLVEAPAEEVFDDVPTAEPVAYPVTVETDAVPAMDDPYLHETQINAEGVVVAQPGWPAPGELASSFDLDAFDPLPEAYGPLKDDTDDEFAVPAAQSDDTTALEIPEFSTGDEVAALEEIEEWTDTFDADGSWSEPDDEVATESTWTTAHEEVLQPEVAAITGPPAIDMENIWSQPDEEPLWDVADVAEVPVANMPAGAIDETSTVDAAEPAWADDSQDAWQDDLFDGPAEAFETSAMLEIPAAAHEMPDAEPPAPTAWSGSIGGPNSPVVLDLAGLAASGHSLELVIEPSADGHGVRLRFGAPDSHPAEAPVVRDDPPQAELFVPSEATIEAKAAGMDDTLEREPAEVGGPAEPEIDVSFLAGVAPGDEPSVLTEMPRVPPASAPFVTPAYAVEPAFVPVPSREDLAMQAAPATTATAVMDADDDPARILADIRARLAALDARR